MNLVNIKILIELILRIFNFCKKQNILSLVKTGIILMIFYMLFEEFYLKNKYFKENKNHSIVRNRMGEITEVCGKNTFVSWLVFDDRKISVEKRKISFVEVLGCIETKDGYCPSSVIFKNKTYLDDYSIGFDDYNYFSKERDGTLYNCTIKDSQATCDGYTPLLLNQIIKLTNFKLKKIHYILVKDFRYNLVYIFTLSFADDSPTICSDQIISGLLLNLFRITKDTL